MPPPASEHTLAFDLDLLLPRSDIALRAFLLKRVADGFVLRLSELLQRTLRASSCGTAGAHRWTLTPGWSLQGSPLLSRGLPSLECRRWMDSSPGEGLVVAWTS